MSTMQPSPISDQSDDAYSLLDIVGTVFRWRKMIFILVAATTLGSVVVSLFLSDYYTARATVIPANEEKELFNTETATNTSLYGDDDAVDRALIFAQSPALIEYMVGTFQLAERYSINASTPKGEDKVAKRFLKLYNVKKNEHSGIELSIDDTDPLQAAQMLDSLIGKLEKLYRGATQSNKQLIASTYEVALHDKRIEMQQLADTLEILRRQYSIYDVAQQSELLSSLVVEAEAELAENKSKLDVYRASGGKRDSIISLEARVNGLTRKLALLNEQNDSAKSNISLHKFNKGRDIILTYEAQAEAVTNEISDIQTKYSQFKAQANSMASSIIVLEPVQTPKIKSYPSRSIIVLAAAFFSLVLGVVAAILLDMYRRIDWQRVLADK